MTQRRIRLSKRQEALLLFFIGVQTLAMIVSWFYFITLGSRGIEYFINARVFPYAQVMEVTAYTAGPESTGKYPYHPGFGITASTHKIQVGDGERCIAAPPEIDFGTRIFVPGYGVGVVKDRGEAIQGNCLDVYFDDLDKALEWGRQWLLVVIFP